MKTADGKAFLKTITKLCGTGWSELFGNRAEFALADRLVVCAPLTTAARKKGMKFAVLHFDHNTCDWIQYFKTQKDAFTVAVWFAQIHQLPIVNGQLSGKQWSSIKVAIQNAKKFEQRFKNLKKAA